MSWAAVATTVIGVAAESSKAPPVGGPGVAGGPLANGAKQLGSTLDGSNWIVNFGTGQTTRASSTHEAALDEMTGQARPSAGPVLGGSVSPLVLIAGIGAAAFVFRKGL